jgi:nucleotide-binding universal stress UspA family protein
MTKVNALMTGDAPPEEVRRDRPPGRPGSVTMRVLLATDGSEDAHAATAYLARFPLPAGSRLRIVSVASIPPSALDVPTVREFQASLREAARQTAEAARAALAPRFADTDVQVPEGDAREAILRAAAEWPADLVVLGARGLGAMAGFVLGSVSLGVARHARCSLLIVKAGADGARGVLVAIDGSEHAAAAAAFMARLPLDPTVLVRLTGVVQPPRYPPTTPGFATGIVRDAIAQIVKERSNALEQALTKAAEPLAGVVKHVERRVLVGHPVDALIGAAGAPDIGLVVVGARGLGTLERLMLGSVSEGVLRHANRPVLIVKEPAA